MPLRPTGKLPTSAQLLERPQGNPAFLSFGRRPGRRIPPVWNKTHHCCSRSKQTYYVVLNCSGFTYFGRQVPAACHIWNANRQCASALAGTTPLAEIQMITRISYRNGDGLGPRRAGRALAAAQNARVKWPAALSGVALAAADSSIGSPGRRTL